MGPLAAVYAQTMKLKFQPLRVFLVLVLFWRSCFSYRRLSRFSMLFSYLRETISFLLFFIFFVGVYVWQLAVSGALSTEPYI